MKFKVISFDLDGTLIDNRPFDNVLWYEEMPKLYSEHHNVPIEKAKTIVTNAYDEIGNQDFNWYRPLFWFKYFNLQTDWRKAQEDLKHELKIFPEVVDLLKELKQKYKLVVVTQSPNEFLKFKMKLEGLQNIFSQVISTIDDLNMSKKQDGTYEEVLKILNVKPEEIMHVGDSFNSDYLAPRKAGIFSLYLDRKKQRTGKGIIYSLEEIKKYL